jgi:NDP-sugar pyrophosphorylase family protein
LIFNGDTLFEADLQHFIASCNGPFNIVLRHVEDSTRYGQIAVNDQFKVLSFIEKGPGLAGGYINAGIYFFSKELLKFTPADTIFSIEQDVLPNLAKAGQLSAVALDGKFIDIGIPEDYQRAQTYLGQFKTPKPVK